jgi:hypothetical protein
MCLLRNINDCLAAGVGASPTVMWFNKMLEHSICHEKKLRLLIYASFVLGMSTHLLCWKFMMYF